MQGAVTETIAVDTNVVIKLIQNKELHLLGGIIDVTFVIPAEVEGEVTYEEQKKVLLQAIDKGWLHRISITDPTEMALFVEISKRVGDGEAACLATAQSRGFSVLSDEKGRFEKDAIARVGTARLLRYEDLLNMAKARKLRS